MKYFLLILLLCVCIYIGYLFSRKYKIRDNFFKALIYLCQKFDIEINYSRQKMKSIFEAIDENYKRDLKGIDKNFISFLDKETPLDKESLFKNINFIKDDEKDLIYNFFRTLGRSDVESQSKEIKNFQTRFESFSQTSSLEQKKYGSLSIKLGIISGLMLVVLFI